MLSNYFNELKKLKTREERKRIKSWQKFMMNMRRIWTILELQLLKINC